MLLFCAKVLRFLPWFPVYPEMIQGPALSLVSKGERVCSERSRALLEIGPKPAVLHSSERPVPSSYSGSSQWLCFELSHDFLAVNKLAWLRVLSCPRIVSTCSIYLTGRPRESTEVTVMQWLKSSKKIITLGNNRNTAKSFHFVYC